MPAQRSEHSGAGRALEDLICYVTGLIPGVAITHRNELNAFDTEEIDVAIWNDGAADGLFFLPNIILVECKNWFDIEWEAGKSTGSTRNCAIED